MRSRIILLASCLFVLYGMQVAAQPKEVKKKIEFIKSDPNYKYGEATGPSFERAYRSALEKLMESIHVFVSADTRRTEIHSQTEKEVLYDAQLYRNLSTYTMGALQNVERIEFGEEPEAHVFVYVLESEVTRMFETRFLKVKSLIGNGLRDEENFRVGDALRYYTWALCLLQTLPNGDSATFEYQGKEEVAKMWLHARINTLLSESQVKVVNVEEVDALDVKYRVYLQLSYKNQLVDNFAFSFYNGMRNIGPIYASDGRAVAEFSEGKLVDELEVKIEYLFRSQAQTLDQELAMVMENIDIPKFSAAQKRVSLHGDEESKHTARKRERKNRVQRVANDVQTESCMTLSSLETNRVVLETVSDTLPYAAVLDRLAGSIRKGEYESVRELFTDSAYVMFDKLIHNGNVTLLDDARHYQFVKYGATVIGRKLPMQFKFSDNRQFVNDVVFRFNAETVKIESLALALTRRSENDILTADKKWKEDWRMDIISFLEDYQTAYALKRLDYLESVFSDDALIVTGVVLKRKAGSSGEGSYLPGASADEVRYTKYTKGEFLDRLRYSFNSKEFINLRFNEVEVVKGSGPRDGIFAMQISQDYYSNNYGDSGYLTLLVDLREELPVIKVRVWQQKKEANFTARTLLNK